MRFAFKAAAVVCCTLCQHSLAQSQSTPLPAAKDSERLVYVIPNNLSIEHQKAFAPISTRTKFKLSAGDVFDWYAFGAAGVNAGVEQATKDHPQYGQGAAGFAKRYGADFGDEATSEFLGDAVFSSLFHQDPRYFRMEHGGIWRRSWYALTRSVVTRDDIGELEFNGSGVFGDYAAASISNLYYPKAERTAGQTAQRGSILLLEDSAFNLLKEFWPDVHNRLRHQKTQSTETPSTD